MKNYIVLLLLLWCAACSSSSDSDNMRTKTSVQAQFVSHRPLSARIESILQKAGSNRKQLEYVLTHYRQHASDSLKLQAALFLLESMESKHTLAGDGYAAYQLFFQRADQLWKQGVLNKKDNKLIWKNRINTLWKTTKQELDSLKNPLWTTQPDLTHVSSAYLIQNIDQAFANWQHSRWAAGVSFESFCEYILPYRVFEEPLEPWRQMLAAKFDSIRLHVTDIKQATTLVNQKLAKEVKFIELYEYPSVMTWSDLKKLRAGKCAHKIFAVVTSMRTLGIPVAIDFVPNWKNIHSWCSLTMPDGSIYPFEAADEPNLSLKGEAPHKAKTDKKAAKIYRITQQKQPQSLAMQVQDETEIPPFFRNPYMKDVTGEYNDPITDVSVPVVATKAHTYAYLCVFVGKEWRPIQWGRIDKNGKAFFKAMGRNIIYFPMVYEKNTLISAGKPFIIHKDGHIQDFQPDGKRIDEVVLYRKGGLSRWAQNELRKMIGGVFQGANKADFSDAVTLHTIQEMPIANLQTISIASNKKFRYVRFFNPGQVCRINELYWHGKQQSPKSHLLQGTLLHSTYPEVGKPQLTTDGDVLTGFTSLEDKGGWIGYDLGEGNEASITRIDFCSPSDGNGIKPTDEYELFYWNQKWESLGVQKATRTQLHFQKVPANTLLLLRNRVWSSDAGIFTYAHSQQVWW